VFAYFMIWPFMLSRSRHPVYTDLRMNINLIAHSRTWDAFGIRGTSVRRLRMKSALG